jgi:hypothetical protein
VPGRIVTGKQKEEPGAPGREDREEEMDMKRWVWAVVIVVAALALVGGGAAFAAYQASFRGELEAFPVEVYSPMMRGGWGGEGIGPGMRGGWGMAVQGQLHEELLGALADGLGIPREDLTSRLEAGESLASIAEAEGLSEGEWTDLWRSAWETALDSAVESGALTRAQADWMLEHMQAVGGGIDCRLGVGGGVSCQWGGPMMDGGFFGRRSTRPW